MVKKIPLVRDMMLRHHIRCLARQTDRREAAGHLLEIAELVAADRNAGLIMKKFGGTKSDICDLYRFLVQGGANLFIHGGFVAASSLANPVILYAWLRDRHKRHDRKFQLGFADTCVRYFEGGYTLDFLHRMLSVPQNECLA